jgi:predicted Fe-Mo cluster-binding NifX family protein
MQPIQLGIGTSDGVSVCDHLARSSAFLIFQIEDGRVATQTVRSRSGDTCGRHATFVELLDGCQAVLCGGIGQGAFDALTAHGVTPLVLAAGMTIEKAVSAYLAGTLTTTGERVCLCD